MALNLLAHGLAVRLSKEDKKLILQREVIDTENQLPQLEIYNNDEKKINRPPT